MSSHDTKNPNGGVNMRHGIESPDPNEHLLERIFSRRNMRKAWKRVKANKGAAGDDGISVEEFPEWLHDRWEGIRESLLDGAYETRFGLYKEIVGEHSLSGYDPITFVNRPVRTRMQGGLGRGS